MQLFLISLYLLLAFPALATVAHAMGEEESIQLSKYLSLTLKTQYLFRSHTSYEFGNPFPPYQVPLSRLEFPLDSWWGGIGLRADLPRFSVGVEALTNISWNNTGSMKDSDWDDGANPALRTIYSESNCRLEPSYMVKIDADLEVSDWLGLPKWLNLRPVVGYRWQSLHFLARDGLQLQVDADPMLLSGPDIRFKQTFAQYFMGFRSRADMSRFTGVSTLNLQFQVDWAYVEARNEDNHLLRPGRRFTYEDTYGHAWHASLGLKKALTPRLTLGVEAEYLRIETTGSHQLVDSTVGIDFSFFNGVRVWSEQRSISFMLEYKF